LWNKQIAAELSVNFGVIASTYAGRKTASALFHNKSNPSDVLKRVMVDRETIVVEMAEGARTLVSPFV
jgi:hypothetical protein